MRRGASSDDSADEGDTSDRASSGEEADSEAESEAWWEELGRQDEERDGRALRGEWQKWFGGKVKLPAPAPARGSVEGTNHGRMDEGVGDEQVGEEEETAQERGDADMGDDEDAEGSDAIPDWLQEMMDAKKNPEGRAVDDDSLGEMSPAEEGDGDGESDADAENEEDDDDDVEMTED